MENIIYEKDKKGQEIVAIVKDNKKIYLNSKYDSYKDMESFLKGFEIKENSKIVLFGIENSIVLKILNKKLSEKGKVIVYDPIFDLYKNICKKDIKINFYTISPKDKNNIYLEIKNIFKATISNYELNRVVLIIQKKYKDLFPEEYKIFIKAFKSAMMERQIDANTLDLLAEMHIKNFVYNIKHIINSPETSLLKETFKDKPAILVSAGPSLEKNFRLLKGNEDKFVIITGGRTLKVLLEEGINPHFVVSMDPSDENFDLFKDVLDSKVPMVCQWLNNDKIVEHYSGVKFFINNTYIKDIDKDVVGRTLLDFEQGGSVATSQFSLAKYLGCNPIAFIGQDLAYTNDKTHADIASYDKVSNKIEIDKDKLMLVKGNIEDVYIDEPFKYFKEWFEMAIQRSQDIKVYNCTEGGVYIKGTVIETLKNYIDNYKSNTIENTKKVDSIINKKINFHDDLKFKEKIQKIIDSINSMIKITKEAIDIIVIVEKNIKQGKNINLFLAKLDQIDREIKKEEENSKFVVYFIQKELNILQNIELNEEDSNKILNVNKKFYQTVKKAYEKTMEIINEINMN